MASSNWSKVRQLVEEALEIPPPERARWLDSACGADRALREEVDGLLAAEDDAERLGESPFPGVIASAVPATFAQPALGARIGSYELVHVIASGGMGTVYEALQRSPQRKVALKVMRESLVTAAERSRFRFEAEVLARLQHPNIAQIYESGVQVEGERGQRRETPYFAMEFVEGHRTLLEYANEHELGLDARVKLFQQVCDAVHHGHQKGVIHRDIKPSNLLVTPAGQVKVIDFGVARAIVQEGAARTLQTQSGQLIGTLGYMSPEQFGADPNAIDVRSDVYALGTVLYELVVGCLPFALEGKALHEIANIVTFERPRRPRSLKPASPAEVEWILLKALEKEPRLRYASASELALDLGRFLDHQPVLAGAPSVIHRVKLAIRRNRAASVIGAAALLVILASGAFYLRSLARARASETQQLYVAMIAAADAALRVGDVAGARGFLQRAPPELRKWEWHHLHARQDESVRTWQEKGHLVAFRPRQDTLTSATHRVVYEWSTGLHQSPQRILELEESWGTTALAWSCDGSVLAIGAQDGSVRLYSIDAEVRMQASASWQDKITSVSFSRDDALVAVASENATICVLDARSGAELAVLRGHRAEIAHALFDPSGTRVYSTGGDGTVRAWDWREGTNRVLTEFRGRVNALALSEDGRTLAAGSFERSVRILDLEDGRELQRFEGLDSGVESLTMARGSTLVLCGLFGGSVEVLDASSGARVRTLLGHQTFVTRISVAADGATVATSAFNDEIKLWNLRAPACATTVRAHWGDIADSVFDPQGRWLVTAGFRDQLVCIWEARTGRLLRVLLEHSQGIISTSVSADGEWLATGDLSGDVRVWRTRDFQSTWTIPARSDPPEDRSRWFRFQGSRLLLLHADGRLERWSMGADTPDDTLRASPPSYRAFEIDPRSKRVVMGGKDGSVTAYAAAGLEVSWSSKAHGQALVAFAFSPDGGTLASASADNMLVLQDARTGHVQQSTLIASGQDAYPGKVSYSPDGARLAVGSTDQLLRLFDAHTLEPILSFSCGGWVSVAFAPDGDALAARTSQGELFVWRGGQPRAGEGGLDLEPRLLARADQVFAGMRSRRAELEETLADIEADRELEPALKEAVLERAHAERASGHELLHRAMQALVARDSAPFHMRQAISRARAVRRVETSDPEASLAQALARMRDDKLDVANRWEFVLSGLERAENSALERGDRVWAAARAGQAIALAHLGRNDEARVRLAEASTCAKFEPGWAALLAEADALLAAQPAK